MHVTQMTLTQEGIYNRLMDHCWLEGCIPADPILLQPLVKGGSTNDIEVVLKRFAPHPERPGFVIHKRMDVDRQRYAEWVDKSRAGGIKSGETRRKQAEIARAAQAELASKGGSTNPSTTHFEGYLNTALTSATALSTSTKALKTLQRAAAKSPDRATEEEKNKNTRKTPQDEPASLETPSPLHVEPKKAPEAVATLATHIKEHGTGKEKTAQAIDPRHTPFKKEVMTFWKTRNGTVCPWDATEGKALNVFLAKNGSTTLQDFSSLLSARSGSDVNTTALPHTFLPKLRQYESGPLNEFGKPKKKARVY